MKKQRITYDSSVDALVNVSKRLSLYEKKYNLVSENFYYKYTKGELTDDNETLCIEHVEMLCIEHVEMLCIEHVEMIEWANDYQHYIALKSEIERSLNSVAS
ncbi:MAG: hypothetical protein L3J08_00325 [Flavobacteriaceae bacterium]|nr:hypothetical protein [Flavobacteriaceae bacterium]